MQFSPISVSLSADVADEWNMFAKLFGKQLVNKKVAVTDVCNFISWFIERRNITVNLKTAQVCKHLLLTRWNKHQQQQWSMNNWWRFHVSSGANQMRKRRRRRRVSLPVGIWDFGTENLMCLALETQGRGTNTHTCYLRYLSLKLKPKPIKIRVIAQQRPLHNSIVIADWLSCNRIRWLTKSIGNFASSRYRWIIDRLLVEAAEGISFAADLIQLSWWQLFSQQLILSW